MTRLSFALGGLTALLWSPLALGQDVCVGNPQSCEEEGFKPGCSNTECCEFVCAIDAFCCEGAWDGNCVAIALKNCDFSVPSCVENGPSSNASENEPCGESINGGCNDPDNGSPFSPLAAGDRVAGNFWADNDTRDTDWYRFTVAEPSDVTALLFADLPARIFIASGECSNLVILATNDAGPCPRTATTCLAPGTYWLIVALDTFNGVPCGSGIVNSYTLELSAAAAECPTPIFITASCEDPGPDTYSTAPEVNTWGGLVACTVSPAAPNCAAGGTTVNSWAKVIPGAEVLSEITCVNFGVWSVRRGTNAAGACVLFIGDRPLPATVGIYRDINGGAPTRPFGPNGECALGDCDLVLVAEREVLVPGFANLGTLTFDPPLCLDGVVLSGETLVVTLSAPNFADPNNPIPGVPANAGYQVRASGATVPGQPSNTFVSLSCAPPSDTQYVLAETLGATFTAQWRVDINGNATTCGGGPPPCPADFDGNGVVNGADLTALLGAWGPCPN